LILQLTLQQPLHQLISINVIYKQILYGSGHAPELRTEFLCGCQRMRCEQITLCTSVHSYIMWRTFLHLGACTQFQNTIIIFIILSVRKEHIGSKLMDFQDFFIRNFSKFCRENLRFINPYPTAFPYGNGMVLHFYQQQESSTSKTVHKFINKRLKTYV
jgi:hypothetical protein